MDMTLFAKRALREEIASDLGKSIDEVKALLDSLF